MPRLVAGVPPDGPGGQGPCLRQWTAIRPALADADGVRYPNPCTAPLQ